MSGARAMETVQEALDRLQAEGYRETLRATAEGFVAIESEKVYVPEDLFVDEIVRFEGRSDPDDQAVVLALRSSSGDLRATLVSSFGANADPVAAELIRRLQDERSASDPGGG